MVHLELRGPPPAGVVMLAFIPSADGDLGAVGALQYHGQKCWRPLIGRRIDGTAPLPQRCAWRGPVQGASLAGERDDHMARVTVEDCTDKVPNRFELVLLAAHLARSREGERSAFAV